MPIQKMIALLLICLLPGCSLTRVSDAAFSDEVDNLNVIGLSLNDARQKVSRQGFTCNDDFITSHVQTDTGVQRLYQLECSKTNLELMCPQIRNVVLDADIKTHKVILVGKRITQRACF